MCVDIKTLLRDIENSFKLGASTPTKDYNYRLLLDKDP